MFTLSQEKPEDRADVEALFDLCFSPGRIALSSYRLRDGVSCIQDLCWIARDTAGALAGAVRFWPVTVGAADALLLGPIAVHPTRQGAGLGAMLMDKTLNKAGQLGWARVLLVGDLPYYQRFGFQKLDGVLMPAPTQPDRVLGYDTQKNGWRGITGTVEKWVIDPPAP